MSELLIYWAETTDLEKVIRALVTCLDCSKNLFGCVSKSASTQFQLIQNSSFDKTKTILHWVPANLTSCPLTAVKSLRSSHQGLLAVQALD